METQTYRGHTRVRRQALEHLAQAVTAEAMNVAHTAVRASLHDRDAALKIAASTPVSITTVDACRQQTDHSVYAYCAAARSQIAQRFTALSNLKVGQVELTLSGIDTTAAKTERSVK